MPDMQFKPCRICSAKPTPKNKPPLPKGYFYQTIIKNEIAYTISKECKCHKRWKANNEEFIRFRKNGFDINLFDYEPLQSDFEGNVIERINTYINKIDDSKVRASVIYLYGDEDKTAIANYIGRQVLKKYSCIKIQLDTLAKLLQRANKEEEEETRIEVEYLKSCDLLIMDNAFSSKQAPWGGYIHSFFMDKLANGNGLMFVSSTLPEKISTVSYHTVEVQNFICKEIQKRNSLFNIKNISNNNIPEVLF